MDRDGLDKIKRAESLARLDLLERFIEQQEALVALFRTEVSRAPTGSRQEAQRQQVGVDEDVLEVVQARLDGVPEASRLRQRTVEHVFGTLKAWTGSTHFLTKTLPRVRTEMSLQVLAYNLQRAIKVVGSARLISEMRA